MQKAVDKLPRGAEICVVEGGNHRGFASYSRQPLDWEVRTDSFRVPVELERLPGNDMCLTALCGVALPE